MNRTSRMILEKGIISLALMLVIITASSGLAKAGSTVVTFGDSITSGYPYRTSNGDGCVNCGGYQYFLQDFLNYYGYDMTVYNYGARGEFTWDGFNRIDSVMAATGANYVLLMEGTNDLAWYVDPYTVAYYDYYIAWKVMAYGGIPVLATITPDTQWGPAYDWKSIQIANDYIRYFVESSSWVCGSDQYNYLAPYWDSGYNYDGLHPNWYGYWLMAAYWFYDLTELKDCSY